MSTWVFSNQPNVIVVAVTYCSLFFVGATLTQAQQPRTPEPKHEVRTSNAQVVMGDDLKRAIRFQRLLAQWKAERGATSSITRMAECDSYVAIMAEGKPVIPLIMEQLRSEGDQPDQWFWALQVLADGLDPVSEADRGNTVKMAEVWLNWWAENPDYAG
jgi:hypothetical protein